MRSTYHSGDIQYVYTRIVLLYIVSICYEVCAVRSTEATADSDFMAQQSLDFKHIYSPNIVPKNKSRFNAETHTKPRVTILSLGH